MKIPKFAR